MRIALTTGWWIWKRRRIFQGGDGTVWHDVTTGRRPGTMIEARLTEIAWLYRNVLDARRGYNRRDEAHNGFHVCPVDNTMCSDMLCTSAEKCLLPKSVMTPDKPPASVGPSNDLMGKIALLEGRRDLEEYRRRKGHD